MAGAQRRVEGRVGDVHEPLRLGALDQPRGGRGGELVRPLAQDLLDASCVDAHRTASSRSIVLAQCPQPVGHPAPRRLLAASPAPPRSRGRRGRPRSAAPPPPAGTRSAPRRRTTPRRRGRRARRSPPAPRPPAGPRCGSGRRRGRGGGRSPCGGRSSSPRRADSARPCRSYARIAAMNVSWKQSSASSGPTIARRNASTGWRCSSRNSLEGLPGGVSAAHDGAQWLDCETTLRGYS